MSSSQENPRASMPEEPCSEQSTKLSTLVYKTIPAIESRQRDLQRQLDSLRSEHDGLLLEEAQKIARNEVAGVSTRVQVNSTDISTLITTVDALQKRLTQEGTNMQKQEQELVETKQKLAAMEVNYVLLVERLKELEAGVNYEFRIPNRPRTSSMVSGQSSTSDLSQRPPTSRTTATQESAQGKSRKRPPTPTMSPSRLNKTKRAKASDGKSIPSATDKDIDSDEVPLSQTRHVGDKSQTPTPRRQPTPVVMDKSPIKASTTPSSTTQSTKTQVKTSVKKEQQKRTRVPTPETLTKVDKDKFRYVRALKTFKGYDFPTYPALRRDHIEATYQFPLFRKEIKNDMYEFFLQTGGKDILEACPRGTIDTILKETHQTGAHRNSVKELGVVEACSFTPRGRLLKDAAYYLLCLGEVYKYTQKSKCTKKESTGWFVFIDVEKSAKPVYMIWLRETYRDGQLVSTATWFAESIGQEGANSKHDFFVLLPGIKQWPSDPAQMILSDDRIKKVIENHGPETPMRFTKPLYSFLVERINEGWDRTVAVRENISSVGGIAKPAGGATKPATGVTKPAVATPRPAGAASRVASGTSNSFLPRSSTAPGKTKK